MPHNQFQTQDLDKHYPSLTVQDECNLDDLQPLEQEWLYNQGMRTVQTILEEMTHQGRVRKPDESINCLHDHDNSSLNFVGSVVYGREGLGLDCCGDRGDAADSCGMPFYPLTC